MTDERGAPPPIQANADVARAVAPPPIQANADVARAVAPPPIQANADVARDFLWAYVFDAATADDVLAALRASGVQGSDEALKRIAAGFFASPSFMSSLAAAKRLVRAGDAPTTRAEMVEAIQVRGVPSKPATTHPSASDENHASSDLQQHVIPTSAHTRTPQAHVPEPNAVATPEQLRVLLTDAAFARGGFAAEVKPSERLKAAELLGKTHGMFIDRQHVITADASAEEEKRFAALPREERRRQIASMTDIIAEAEFIEESENDDTEAAHE